MGQATSWILLVIGLTVHFLDYFLHIRYKAVIQRLEANVGKIRLIGYLGDIISILAVLKLLEII
ncbi:hypothetical protein AKJ41_02045 [candidate division MSBL1 archaeon SCGC-AAA259O05]|uniref:Uncharacterized protein n=1 Tax=candidate division MSBL1 archaeon SCGC-AAA259O05 TaxID=1698271 RepID=A0A133V4E0_9EURY|nr:hypothetical protein AKJ41_02045 [candidate division MSBL1 archaeon SCGC-AAA259O05]